MSENADKTNIWREAVSAGDDCISVDELQRVLEGSSSDQNSARHVDGCPHCQAELVMMRTFQSPKPDEQEAAAMAWIVGRLSYGAGASVLPATAPPIRKALWRLPYLAGGVAVALAMILGVSLFMRNQGGHPVPTVEPSGLQTMRSASVYITAPSGNIVQTPAIFQWDAFPGAQSYFLEVTEVDGSILWSGHADSNFLRVSPDLAKKLPPNRTFVWKVTALDSSGKAMATSNRERFVIKLEHADHH